MVDPAWACWAGITMAAAAHTTAARPVRDRAIRDIDVLSYVRYAWSSATCPAGQPVFAVKVSRRNRWAADGTGMVTVFCAAGSNTYPRSATTCWKAKSPSASDTSIVCVRAPHEAGSLTTSRPTAPAVDPRSTVNDCGSWELTLSQ